MLLFASPFRTVKHASQPLPLIITLSEEKKGTNAVPRGGTLSKDVCTLLFQYTSHISIQNVHISTASVISFCTFFFPEELFAAMP